MCNFVTDTKDVIKIERWKKRFTRVLTAQEDLNYKERTDRLGVFALQCRGLRNDFLKVNNIMRAYMGEWSQSFSQGRGERSQMKEARFKGVLWGENRSWDACRTSCQRKR